MTDVSEGPQVSEEPVKEAGEEVEPDKVNPEAPPDLASILKAYPNAPSAGQIEEWKKEFGEVFCSGFSETELYVWRTLSRPEWVSLQKRLRIAPKEDEEQFTELDMEEEVVNKCMLWSSNEKSLVSKGGTVSTISEQVMLNSNFVAPAVASALVIKL